MILEEERFARSIKLIGETGMEKLQAASVAICGVGGVGSFTAEALARSGIGQLLLIDFDTVSISNINRQILANSDSVGQVKVEVMRRRIDGINPACRVKVEKQFIGPENAAELLPRTLDYVVDAIDNVPGKVAIIQHCLKNGIRVVCSMGTGNKFYPEKLKTGDISESSVCPLARSVRRHLRQVGIEKGVPVVYSTEKPLPVSDAGSRQVPGSMSFVPPVAGMMLAGLVVRGLLGYED